MSRWSQYLARAANLVDRSLDSVRYRLSERLSTAAPTAYPFVSYGTPRRLLVRGRVLTLHAIEPAREDATLWQNLKSAYRRFESDEAPYAEVLLRFGDVGRRVVADDEGYFEYWFELPRPLPPDHGAVQWVEIDLLSPIPRGVQGTRTAAAVMVPSVRAEFGIVSDLDDTVMQTGATSLLSMARNVLLGNARTRLPFAGVDAFYRALHRDINPIFYVSSGPWNLYDVVVEFLDINGVPMGPIVLRDWGITATELLPTAHGVHKLEAIDSLLTTYPDLPFLLIGDSGQEDPEIYTEVVRRYRKQIVGIYIRDVTGDAVRSDEIRALAEEVANSGCDLVLVPDTVAAARHAADRGHIPASAVADVAAAAAPGGPRGGD